MGIKDLEVALKIISDNGGGDFEGEKGHEIIERAEHLLGLKFPPSYKMFLSKLGCGDIGGLEFYGIVGENLSIPSIPNAIWLTLDERKHGLPASLIIVSSVGDGTYFALETSEVNSHGENPIVYYSIDGRVEKAADNYGEFFLSEVRAVL